MEIEVGFPLSKSMGRHTRCKVRDKQPLMLSAPRDPAEKKEEDL